VQQADGMWIWRYEPVLDGMLADIRQGGLDKIQNELRMDK